MSITAIAGAVGGLTSLASEFIEDADKRNEYLIRSQEINKDIIIALVQQETNPWVDGAVKILAALNQFWRPLASIGAFAYSIIDPSYLVVLKEIDPTLATMAGAAAFGAAPLWGLSRHKEKVEKAKTGWEH